MKFDHFLLSFSTNQEVDDIFHIEDLEKLARTNIYGVDGHSRVHKKKLTMKTENLNLEQ